MLVRFSKSSMVLFAFSFVCTILLVFQASGPYLRRSNSSIDLISIGTVARKDVHSAYLRASFRHVYLYNERTPGVEKCILCRSKSIGCHPTNDAWFWKSDGWWCAQKRPLAALVNYLKSTKLLPDWLLVVDDDTFINPISLHILLRSLSPSNFIYMGDTIGTDYIAGGGGWLISKPVIKALKIRNTREGSLTMPVEKCLSKQQGGSMCWYHSDWAIAKCILSTSNTKPVHSSLFQQYTSSFWFTKRNVSAVQCPTETNRCMPCKSTSVTCHKYSGVEQLNAIEVLLGM